jgi:mannosyl-oligosaccharide glucosidase
LLGGIGYFYGTSLIDPSFSYEWDDDSSPADSDDDDGKRTNKGPRLTEPKALLTATPSRSFFPRGFYWDEGFHLLHIGEWDNDLRLVLWHISVAPIDSHCSLEILKDWINLVDEDGWVAREQILGEEAHSKACYVSYLIVGRFTKHQLSGPTTIPDTGSQLCQPPNVIHGRDCIHQAPKASDWAY